MNFRDVTVTLSQSVLILVSNTCTSQSIGLVHFIINELFGLLEEIGIKSSVAFSKYFSIYRNNKNYYFL